MTLAARIKCSSLLKREATDKGISGSNELEIEQAYPVNLNPRASFLC